MSNYERTDRIIKCYSFENILEITLDGLAIENDALIQNEVLSLDRPMRRVWPECNWIRARSRLTPRR